MCAYCQCLLPLLPYYLITLPNVCLLSMLITLLPITLLLYLMCAYCQCLLPLLPITLLLYLMCAYCQCLLPLLPYYLITLPNVCLLSMLITIITLLPYYFT